MHKEGCFNVNSTLNAGHANHERVNDTKLGSKTRAYSSHRQKQYQVPQWGPMLAPCFFFTEVKTCRLYTVSTWMGDCQEKTTYAVNLSPLVGVDFKPYELNIFNSHQDEQTFEKDRKETWKR
jgi:hypothetical protein